jgi:hypothetical protein
MRPSRALFEVALFGLTKWIAREFFALKGPKHISPGQSAAPPRVPETGGFLALKGQNKRRTASANSGVVSPLQATL